MREEAPPVPRRPRFGQSSHGGACIGPRGAILPRAGATREGPFLCTRRSGRSGLGAERPLACSSRPPRERRRFEGARRLLEPLAASRVEPRSDSGVSLGSALLLPIDSNMADSGTGAAHGLGTARGNGAVASRGWLHRCQALIGKVRAGKCLPVRSAVRCDVPLFSVPGSHRCPPAALAVLRDRLHPQAAAGMRRSQRSAAGSCSDLAVSVPSTSARRRVSRPIGPLESLPFRGCWRLPPAFGPERSVLEFTGSCRHAAIHPVSAPRPSARPESACRGWLLVRIPAAFPASAGRCAWPSPSPAPTAGRPLAAGL